MKKVNKRIRNRRAGNGRELKREIRKGRVRDYGHLATFRKSCQCRDVRSGNVMLGVMRECDVGVGVQM